MHNPEISQILVLGGGVDEEGKLDYLSVERAQRASRCTREADIERIVFSGGTSWLENHEITPRSEAEMMAEMAIDLGVPESIVTCEDTSTNTLTNIALSRKFLDDEKAVGIVTHEFHMPRSLRIARKLLASTPEPITPENNYPELRSHEIIAAGISAVILLGLRQDDCEEAVRRNDALQARMHRSKAYVPSILRPSTKQQAT